MYHERYPIANIFWAPRWFGGYRGILFVYRDRKWYTAMFHGNMKGLAFHISLRCLGPWMKHLTSCMVVHFRLMFFNWQLMWTWNSWEELSIDFLPLFMSLYIIQLLPIIVPLKSFYSFWNKLFLLGSGFPSQTPVTRSFVDLFDFIERSVIWDAIVLIMTIYARLMKRNRDYVHGTWQFTTVTSRFPSQKTG